eukprot:CAMPEP_0174256148 /NCGR_PEP_ID=MMETSP0439-20130205/5400_1 /TAXON_ID=0 /ORGANISM="Stereomyxa ramosa, Strain Chinc5" /LENGTH=138 /DNA_ID=CAMNT_0015338629 /DNA_START=551 /DNA_END=967 /DNA_ORIENTATION=-
MLRGRGQKGWKAARAEVEGRRMMSTWGGYGSFEHYAFNNIFKISQTHLPNGRISQQGAEFIVPTSPGTGDSIRKLRSQIAGCTSKAAFVEKIADFNILLDKAGEEKLWAVFKSGFSKTDLEPQHKDYYGSNRQLLSSK